MSTKAPTLKQIRKHPMCRSAFWSHHYPMEWLEVWFAPGCRLPNGCTPRGTWESRYSTEWSRAERAKARRAAWAALEALK